MQQQKMCTSPFRGSSRNDLPPSNSMETQETEIRGRPWSSLQRYREADRLYDHISAEVYDLLLHEPPTGIRAIVCDT